MIDHGSKCNAQPCTCGAKEANRAHDPKLHNLWHANKPTLIKASYEQVRDAAPLAEICYPLTVGTATT